MFGIFKRDPIKNLRKQYDLTQEQAMQAQRKGDIKSYASLSSAAESIWQQIELALRQASKN
ncbi:DUF6435 family protein [Shewanella sp. 10N.286.48.B5]|uniref:DUF6435 family protein n=1 Tax=Shewanella sp. 10N.286.48.B5 TaxID=1880834 RepID=UPI000C860102|nr:DUF6435 family protein [Shewanella sp. 10N.286.48.B5]PMH86818.1 hypothetical protein BCU57_09535 [Shewanella sp. 10N.286.48.B5]